MAVLVSFDIDGTLEAGDPPGPITMEMVKKAQSHGCIIGSSSDRPLPVQQGIWDRFDIKVSFVSAKHQLPDIMARFPADAYYHIGDTQIDQQYAVQAGFQFLWMEEGVAEPWIDSTKS
ncbi:MAG: HAD family hydrolase [Chloroflexota bacterium]|nr:HAD family hydrolase [Chloroflexota bacterium]